MASYRAARASIWAGIALFLLLLTVARLPVEAAQMRDMGGDLILTVATDASTLARGDTLRIAATVKNISPHRVLLFARPAAYATAHVNMQTTNGTPLPAYINIIFSLAPPSRQDILELDPGAEWTVSFRAHLREMVFRDVQTKGYPEVRGLFLDFGNSSIGIPSAGRYELSVEMNYREDAMTELEASFGLSGIWRGLLRSDLVPLEVR